MAREFKLPDLGEGVHEGQIVRLHFKEGDHVKEDQPLMEVETDKAAVEIPSPFSGVIEKWNVKEGQVVHVGDVMVGFGGEAKEGVEVKEEAARAKPQAAPGSGTAVAERATGSVGTRAPASPAVRKLARQLGVDLESVKGSGPGGRISREDVERFAKGGGEKVVSAPVARAVRAKPQAAPVGALPDGTDDSDQYGPIRRVLITQARKTIANVMSQSWSTTPHATDTDDADVTDLEKLRRGYLSEENSESGPKLTMLAFVIRAVVRALQRYPEFNASFEAEKHEIIYRRYINIAVGVHTERGLIAPVIRDADRLDVRGLATALSDIAEKARSASFAVNDTRGGTYTISNPGAVGGSRYSTPIITPPQVAVLAIGRSKWMPWVVNSGAGSESGTAIKPRLIMPLSHSIDHRILDGGQEVQFLRHVIDDLENPGRLVL